MEQIKTMKKSKVRREQILNILGNKKMSAKEITAKLLVSDGLLAKEEDIDSMEYKKRQNEISKTSYHLKNMNLKNKLEEPKVGTWMKRLYYQ